MSVIINMVLREECGGKGSLQGFSSGLELFGDHLWSQGHSVVWRKTPWELILSTLLHPHISAVPIWRYPEENRSHPGGTCRKMGVCPSQEGAFLLPEECRDVSECVHVSSIFLNIS